MFRNEELISLMTEKQKQEIATAAQKKIMEQIKAIKITKSEIHVDIQNEIDSLVDNSLDRVDFDKVGKAFTNQILKGLN